MSVPNPVPLYPTLDEIHALDLADYPQVNEFLNQDQPWRRQHWSWGLDFLKYVGRNKSEHTYARFRSETEKFLLWVFLVKKNPVDGFLRDISVPTQFLGYLKRYHRYRALPPRMLLRW